MGFREPNSPRAGLVLAPAPKYNVLGSPPFVPLPKVKPQRPLKLDRRSTCVDHTSDKSAGSRIESVDGRFVQSQRVSTSHEQAIAESSKARRCDSQSPGISQRSTVNRERRVTHAVGIKLTNKSQVRVRSGSYLSIGDIQRAAQVLNVVRMKIRREGGIYEISGDRSQIEVLVENIDLPISDVSRIKKIARSIAADGESGVRVTGQEFTTCEAEPKSGCQALILPLIVQKMN